MADDEYFSGIPYLEEVIKDIKLILDKGFGEVRVIIRNGVIYRILPTSDKIMGMKEGK